MSKTIQILLNLQRKVTHVIPFKVNMIKPIQLMKNLNKMDQINPIGKLLYKRTKLLKSSNKELMIPTSHRKVLITNFTSNQW